MTNKTTKSSLLLSSISLLLCFAMLIGTTFAWFTDSATSAGNKIVAGNLDVQLLMGTGTGTGTNGYTEITNESAPIFGGEGSLIAQNNNANTLWEPGKTQVAYLAIKNNGSLDLKYNVSLIVKNEAKDLYKTMEYDIIPDKQYGEVTEWTKAGKSVNVGAQLVSGNDDVELKKGITHYFALAIHMKEEAGNEYQNGQVEFDIVVNATQLNSEADSFGPDYDKNAENATVVSNADELKAAFTDGADTISVSAGTYTFPVSSISEGDIIICDEDTVFEGVSKLNIKGATVDGATFKNPNGSAADQTINGTFKNCTFTGKNGLRWCYAGETVVFENCVFDGSLYGVHFDGGANYVTFKNCTISGFNAMGGAIMKTTFEGCTFVSNGKSAYNGINMWGDTDMKNCTFIFDGSCSYEWIDLCGANKTATFTDCVVNDGTNISNVSTLIGDKLTKREASGKIIVDGSELSY